MAENRITHKDLWKSLDGVTQKNWESAADRLGLSFSYCYGKGSHAVIRDPQYPDPADIRGLIVTVQKNLYKQANRSIFKKLIDWGISEDDIWKALGYLDN